MKAKVLTIKSQFLFVFSLLVFHFSSAQQSTFDVNDEGWKVIGDVQGFTTIPEYDSTGGNPGGYCYAVDVGTGDYWYWVAPDTFLGDKSASFNKFLRFDLKQSNTSNQANRADIILEGTGIKIYYNTPYNPDTAWTHYDVLLDTAGWERNSYGSGLFVTKSDFQQLLSHVTKLWIRGEYRIGADIGSMDNVILEPVISSSAPLISTAIQSMDVYPNPARDHFTLSLKGDPQKNVLVDVFNSTGQRVFSEMLDFQSGAVLKQYPCRDWPSGMYWVRVSEATGGIYRKIVIE